MATLYHCNPYPPSYQPKMVDYAQKTCIELMGILESIDNIEELKKVVEEMKTHHEVHRMGDLVSDYLIPRCSKKVHLMLGIHENEELQDAFDTSATADGDFY